LSVKGFAFVPDDCKVVLNEIAAFGYVLCCFHFVASKHPHLDICIEILLLALIRSRIVYGT